MIENVSMVQTVIESSCLRLWHIVKKFLCERLKVPSGQLGIYAYLCFRRMFF
jgi:hypothetical protein